MGEAIPPGSDKEIRENVERGFDLELKAVRNLDALSDRLIAQWTEQAGNRNAADRILTLSIARGTTTFKACQRLVLGGFGREAMMLNRSMFEGDGGRTLGCRQPRASRSSVRRRT